MVKKYRAAVMLILLSVLFGGCLCGTEAKQGCSDDTNGPYIYGFADGQEDSRKVDLRILDGYIAGCAEIADMTQSQNCVDTLMKPRNDIYDQSLSTPTAMPQP